MKKDLETYSHLLANPYFCKKDNTIEKKSEDILLLKALQTKFPDINISEKGYYQNISKIENLLVENTIKNSIDTIIQVIEDE
jgi:hypothetical protein